MFSTTRPRKKSHPRSTAMADIPVPPIELELPNNYYGSTFSSSPGSNKSVTTPHKISKEEKIAPKNLLP